MGKKRKSSGRQKEEEVPGFEPRGGTMKAINSYEDIADSEDEFHMQREKIMLDDGPEAKRRRKWQEEDAALEPSDEEVLAYSESEDEDEEVEEPTPRRKTNGKNVSDSEQEEEEEEEEEGWGTSRKDYYNNDQIETEADALEEEAEAKRLQQKKLQKMSEADFGFDESEWLDADEGGDDGDVVTEVLKDVEITSDMGQEERLRILQTRYPEFDFLANELLQLQPWFVELQAQAQSGGSPVLVVKGRALAAYISSLTMYFAVLTSPAKGAQGVAKTLDPAELRDHPVMDSILQCRELWSKVKNLKAPAVVEIEDSISMEEYPETNGHAEEPALKPKKKTKKELARLAAIESASALRAQKIAAAESELASLSKLMPKAGRISKKTKIVSRSDSDSNSDFGEESTMDAKSAAEKAQKKKSLRFYTSQIAQKANKRSGAGREAGGDEDLPHRERLRDRQARLNAEAEKRGKKLDEYGRGRAAASALGGDSGSDGEEERVAAHVRGEGDEYYDLIAQTSSLKKLDKEARMAAIAQAKAEGGLVRVVEGEVDENGKRAIGYVIQKNKGLAPKRKKDVRNPRVKKRKKYEEKKKKLASSRATYKGGEERGGYGGEKTGIKTGLVKSIKL